MNRNSAHTNKNKIIIGMLKNVPLVYSLSWLFIRELLMLKLSVCRISFNISLVYRIVNKYLLVIYLSTHLYYGNIGTEGMRLTFDVPWHRTILVSRKLPIRDNKEIFSTTWLINDAAILWTLTPLAVQSGRLPLPLNISALFSCSVKHYFLKVAQAAPSVCKTKGFVTKDYPHNWRLKIHTAFIVM